MPHLSLQISPLGPMLDIAIGVNAARSAALQRAGKSVPQPVQLRGLIDTGATSTCIDSGSLHALGLSPTGIVSMLTPSTGGTPHVCHQYDVSLTLLHPSLHVRLDTIAVMESELAGHGIHALIGRDILARCLFVYDGQAGGFALAF